MKLKWEETPLSENDKAVGFFKRLKAQFDHYTLFIHGRTYSNGMKLYSIHGVNYHLGKSHPQGSITSLAGAKKAALRLLEKMHAEVLLLTQRERREAQLEEVRLSNLRLPNA